MKSVIPLLKIPEADSANFNDFDLKVGRLLRFYGRYVTKVFRVGGFYGHHSRVFARPRKRWHAPNDLVRLVALDGSEVRTIGVGYVTGSALWHLLEEPR